MTRRPDKLLLWTPRILGIPVCLFPSPFALDAVGGGRPLLHAVPDFAIHLAPIVFLLVVVAVSWRWEWGGGLVFTCLAAGEEGRNA